MLCSGSLNAFFPCHYSFIHGLSWYVCSCTFAFGAIISGPTFSLSCLILFRRLPLTVDFLRISYLRGDLGCSAAPILFPLVLPKLSALCLDLPPSAVRASEPTSVHCNLPVSGWHCSRQQRSTGAFPFEFTSIYKGVSRHWMTSILYSELL